MSGDAQPKKRKDKRRKKDEITEELVPPPSTPPPAHHHHGPSTDEIIHIHKDIGLGGNICTKLIFFCLLGALGLMVGLILVEYRGSSDEETISAIDSPWSVMFENWVETVPDAIHVFFSAFLRRAKEVEEDEEDGVRQPRLPRKSLTKPPQTKEEEESDEELFPEAIEALKKEQEEQQRETEQVISNYEKSLDEPVPTEEEEIAEEEGEEEETSGRGDTGATESVQKKEVVRSEEEPIPTAVPIQPKPVEVVAEKKEVPTVKSTLPELPKVAAPSVPAPKPKAEVEEDEEYTDEEEEEDEEDEGPEAAEVRRRQEAELLQRNYERLLAQFGQPSGTPESSDPEQSDDDAAPREYSDGGEEESVGEEESGGEAEEGSEPEEEHKVKWTSMKQNVATESDEEEEESEDEAPPAVVKRPAGGQKSTEEDYSNADITNEYDWEIRETLDEVDEDLENLRTQPAQAKISTLLGSHPLSPRARYARGRALDLEAEAKKSNAILGQAIEAYLNALAAPDIPDTLLLKISSRTINRMRFRGLHLKAVPVHRKLIERFNNTPTFLNDLGINYLMVNQLQEAGAVFKEALAKWPDNAMALAHYGLVLKLQGNHKDSISFMEAGLKVDIPETRDPRLYFHLGDALSREGFPNKALKVYEGGVEKGLFRSKYQRSLYNVDRLTARPWWKPDQTSYGQFFRKLEENWKAIREEGLTAMKIRGSFQDEAENLRDRGDWKQFELFARGRRYAENCRKAPITCGLISEFEPARSCSRGQSKFSVMEAGTHVWPHCGPTNCRLRAHLGLVVPPGPALRVAETTRTWEEGKVIVFDDSFEHEVWHNGTSLRLVLIVDVWHPELTRKEWTTLSPI